MKHAIRHTASAYVSEPPILKFVLCQVMTIQLLQYYATKVNTQNNGSTWKF